MNTVTPILQESDVFHAGEIRMQVRAGVLEKAKETTSYIRSFLPHQHQSFYQSLPYALVSTLDNKGRFIGTPTDKSISIRLQIMEWDPLLENLKNPTKELVNGGVPFGMLGIELHTRRRNRVNGHITEIEPNPQTGLHELIVDVDQSYGNCPKYIQTRQLLRHRTVLQDLSHEHIDLLSQPTTAFPKDVREIIMKADSFYIASRGINSPGPSRASGLDVSHRGGNRGFVHVLADNRSFVWPDYSGNNMFMTLGNLLNDSRAGILFIDYDESSVVYITGVATVLFDGEATKLIPGMKRVVMFTAEELIFAHNTLPFEFQFLEASPFNPPVKYASQSIEHFMRSSSTNWATLVGVKRISRDTSSFTFETSQPVTYLPGQYAMFDFSSEVRVQHLKSSSKKGIPASMNDDLLRTWTISSTPSLGACNQITITVKKKQGGLVSTFLHDYCSTVSQENELRIPLIGVGGTFTIPHSNITSTASPKYLFLAAGVGITPFLSMLPATQGADVRLLVTARQEDDLYLSILQPLSAYASITAFLTKEQPKRREGNPNPNPNPVDVRAGRLDALHLIESVEDLSKRIVYICGPQTFMDSMMQICEQSGLDENHIHYEEFSF